ncbi:MAG: hypothetical protein ACRD3J_23110 [Thermoanaerobaculia bacterium]
MRLFAEKGYGWTSVADILHAAGANAGRGPTKKSRRVS